MDIENAVFANAIGWLTWSQSFPRRHSPIWNAFSNKIIVINSDDREFKFVAGNLDIFGIALSIWSWRKCALIWVLVVKRLKLKRSFESLFKRDKSIPNLNLKLIEGGASKLDFGLFDKIEWNRSTKSYSKICKIFLRIYRKQSPSPPHFVWYYFDWLDIDVQTSKRMSSSPRLIIASDPGAISVFAKFYGIFQLALTFFCMIF